jgi:hypothetical protein
MAPKKPDCKWHKGTPENSRPRGRPGENRGDFFVERVIADLRFTRKIPLLDDLERRKHHDSQENVVQCSRQRHFGEQLVQRQLRLWLEPLLSAVGS